jgi:hypothetical protein
MSAIVELINTFKYDWIIGTLGAKVVLSKSITAGFGLKVIEFGLVVVVVCLIGDKVVEDCVEDDIGFIVVVGVVISITIGGAIDVILCVVVGVWVVVVVVVGFCVVVVVVVVVVGLWVVVVVVVGFGVVVVVVVVGLGVVVVVVISFGETVDVVVVVDVVDVVEANKLVIIGTSFSEISDSEVGSLTDIELWEEDSKLFWPSSPASSWLSVEFDSKSIKDVSGMLDQLGAWEVFDISLDGSWDNSVDKINIISFVNNKNY